jgi:hypothetical protein
MLSDYLKRFLRRQEDAEKYGPIQLPKPDGGKRKLVFAETGTGESTTTLVDEDFKDPLNKYLDRLDRSRAKVEPYTQVAGRFERHTDYRLYQAIEGLTEQIRPLFTMMSDRMRDEKAKDNIILQQNIIFSDAQKRFKEQTERIDELKRENETLSLLLEDANAKITDLENDIFNLKGGAA